MTTFWVKYELMPDGSRRVIGGHFPAKDANTAKTEGMERMNLSERATDDEL